MKRFSVRPTLTLRGRAVKGLRGWAGKPFHPPLTDVPIAAYILAAAFDAISVIGGDDRAWAEDFWHAGTYTLIGGFAISVFAALTGLVDARTSSEAGTQARRTINTHAAIMIVVTSAALVDMIWRLDGHGTEPATPPGVMILTIAIAVLVSVGATYGGTLVFDYGFNVETAGDHPVWHRSEVDVLPGDHGNHGET